MQFKKEALDFLKELKENNNRDWFDDSKTKFKEHQAHAKDFYKAIREVLEHHDQIENFKLFRIYRDVRFSKDKTPYQPHFAGSFSRYGKALRGGYYLRIRPGESFLAGGFWQPNKDDLLRIRKEIEFSDLELRTLMEHQDFMKYFIGKLEGETLKTAPRGFSKDHKAIDLLRKKGFIAVRKFTDEQVLSNNFLNEINLSFLALRPFFDYMSSVLTTDLNGASTL